MYFIAGDWTLAVLTATLGGSQNLLVERSYPSQVILGSDGVDLLKGLMSVPRLARLLSSPQV